MQRAERSRASYIPSTNQDCLEFRQVMTPTGRLRAMNAINAQGLECKWEGKGEHQYSI